MLKKIRDNLAEYHTKKNLQIQKRASIIIPLVESNGEIFIMLTQRSYSLTSHAGQVAFPGGKQDPNDASSLDTALRETNEEIGLPKAKVEILGTLDQILSLHYYLVTPFVAVIPDDFIPIPNSDEIQIVFRVPLTFFMTTGNHWAEEIETQFAKVFVHHFEFEGYDIWGLTAKLILRLLEIGLGHVPDFIVHHPDSPTWMERTLDYS